MILTITLNPSVDYLYQLSHLKIGTTNRIPQTLKMVGGKGINAARICTILQQPSIATGIVAGNNGDYIIHGMNRDKINHSFISIDGESRNCITILHDEGSQTELMEQGPIINEPAFKKISRHIVNLLKSKPINVIGISGSINSVDKRIYADLIKIIKTNTPDVKIIVDTSGEFLKQILNSEEKPYFIKPNLEEINELLHINIKKEYEIIEALKNNLFSGVYGILVSLGSSGGLAKVNGTFYRLKIPTINVISPEGSGDSTVGGLLTSIDKDLSIIDILKYAMAAGMANAQQSKTGFMKLSDFWTNFKRIQVLEVKNEKFIL